MYRKCQKQVLPNTRFSFFSAVLPVANKKYGNVIKWYFWRADTSPGRYFLEWLTAAVGVLWAPLRLAWYPQRDVL